MPVIRSRGPGLPGPVSTKMGQAAPAGLLGTIPLTTTTSAPGAGTMVFSIAAWAPNNASDSCVFTDNVGGNTWTTILSVKDSIGTALAFAVGMSTIASTMAVGKIITATITSSGGTVAFRQICAFNEVSKLFPVPMALDGTNHNSLTTVSAITTGSVTPTQAPDWGIAVYMNDTGRTGTAPGGWSEFFDFTDSGVNDGLQVNIMPTFTTSIAANNPSETLSGSAGNAIAGLAMFKYTRNASGLVVAQQALMQASNF